MTQLCYFIIYLTGGNINFHSQYFGTSIYGYFNKGDFCLRVREKVKKVYCFTAVSPLSFMHCVNARFSVLRNLTTEPLKENHSLIGP